LPKSPIVTCTIEKQTQPAPDIVGIRTLVGPNRKGKSFSWVDAPRDLGYDGDLLELMRQDDKMAKKEKNLMHDNVKEDDGGDNGHKIIINHCDGDGW
jgi:hypothetical protein